MIKRISKITLSLCLLLSFAIPCFAEFQPDSNRWVWLSSTDTAGIWYDKATVNVRNDYGSTKVDMWILLYFLQPVERLRKTYWTIDIQNKKLYLAEIYTYNMDGKLISSKSLHGPGKSVIPDSNGEIIYNVALQYALPERVR